MATDIAFSLGVVSMLGRTVPLGLKIFLTALAVVDDLGAVLVIAFFYTAQLSWTALGLAGLCAIVLWFVGRFGLRSWFIYAVLGLVLWVAMYKSGIHATLAGVIVAFLVPGGPEADPPLERWAHALKPWVNLGIMPIFALANAGLVVSADSLQMLTEPISLGIILGLFLGKPIGIACFCALAVKIGWSSFPARQRFIQFIGVGCLAGIGFTMSIFIAGLAFPEVASMDQAKAGILLASLISAIVGATILKLSAHTAED
jgi:NhaA family Na+:H+ antiporter